MVTCNYKKSSSRQEFRARLQGQLDALEKGTWPRDLNDIMFWNRPVGLVRGRTWEGLEGQKDWARAMCETEITYLNDIDRRLAEGDPELWSWEGWVAPDLSLSS